MGTINVLKELKSVFRIIILIVFLLNIILYVKAFKSNEKPDNNNIERERVEKERNERNEGIREERDERSKGIRKEIEDERNKRNKETKKKMKTIIMFHHQYHQK